MRAACSLLALWLVVLGPGVAWSQQVAAGLDGVEAAVEAFIEDGTTPGAVTLVRHGGEVVHLAAQGEADLQSHAPMREETLFAIASMTKPITATALMMLVDEGRVSLDDPVAKHLPAFAGAKTASGEPARGLTLRRLLTHTSGLTGKQDFATTLAASADELATRPLAFQPGDRWEYGPSITVVGRIVEVVAGVPFEEFVDDRLFDPLGMHDTTFHPSPEQLARVATLYKPGPKGGAKLVPDQRIYGVGEPCVGPNPSAGLFSTADDLGRFYQMVLDGGVWEGRRLVSEASVRAMTTPQSGDHATGFTPGNAWGLGWCLVQKPQGVTDALSPGTFGHGGAYGTGGWVDPRRGAVFVYLIQRSQLPNADGSEFRAAFQRAATRALDGGGGAGPEGDGAAGDGADSQG